jgi:hypothetical protein
MKKSHYSLRSWSCLLVPCLGLLALDGRAEEAGNTVAFEGAAGGGVAFVHAGGGEPGVPQRGFAIHFGADIGASILTACDVNSDGGVAPDELKAATALCLKDWDLDTTSSLTQSELATGLTSLFPAPQPPPGGSLPPEEFRLPVRLSKGVVATADTDKDGSITALEVSTAIDQNFTVWDSDKSGSLNALECAGIIGHFVRPGGGPGAPGAARVFGQRTGGGVGFGGGGFNLQITNRPVPVQ